MKSGHESETTRAGHNVRRVASVQFSAPHVDIRFEKLHIDTTMNELSLLLLLPPLGSQIGCPFLK